MNHGAFSKAALLHVTHVQIYPGSNTLKTHFHTLFHNFFCFFQGHRRQCSSTRRVQNLFVLNHIANVIVHVQIGALRGTDIHNFSVAFGD